MEGAVCYGGRQIPHTGIYHIYSTFARDILHDVKKYMTMKIKTIASLYTSGLFSVF